MGKVNQKVAIETGLRLAQAETTLGLLRYYADNFANPPGPVSDLTVAQREKRQCWREVQAIMAIGNEEPK